MSKETLQNRLTNEAMTVNIGAMIAPSGNGGSPTYLPKPYTEESDDLSGVGRGLTNWGNAANSRAKEQAKAEEMKLLGQFDMDVYNIQRNPEMSASEKEIRVTDVYNKYPQLSVEKKHSVLSAHGADVKNTQMWMSENKKKEDVKQTESDQRKSYAELAVKYDPYVKTLSPDEQYTRGKELEVDLNKHRTFVNEMLLNPDDPELQAKLGESGKQFARNILPTDFRIKFFKGELTQQDIQDFKENYAMQIQVNPHPVTGRTYSATEAYNVASFAFDPMFKDMAEERERVDKLTSEIQKRHDEDLVRKAMKETDFDAYMGYLLTGKDPAIANESLGISSNSPRWQLLKSSMRQLYAGKDGRLVFPKTMPNDLVSMIAQNNSMPEAQNDAQSEILERQKQTPITPANSQNMREFLDNSPNYLNNLPQEYRGEKYNVIKDRMSTNLAKDAQSLISKRIDNLPEDAPWYQKVLAKGYNAFADFSEMVGLRDAESYRRDLDDMIKDYTKSLRNAGCTSEEASDVIKSALTKLGIGDKDYKPLSDEDIPYFFRFAIDRFRENILTRTGAIATTEFLRDITHDKEGAVDDIPTMFPKEPEGKTNTSSLMSQNVQPEKDTNEGKINMADIYNTKEYRDVISQLAKQGKARQITREQAENEVGQLVARVASELFGIKNAEAATKTPPVPGPKPAEIEGQKISDDFIMKQKGRFKAKNNPFNLKVENSNRFRTFNDLSDSVQACQKDVTTKLNRHEGDILKLCNQYAPRSDKNIPARYCCAILYRTKGVSEADKKELDNIVNYITNNKKEDGTSKAARIRDAAMESVVKQYAEKYKHLFYKNGKPKDVNGIVQTIALMETGTHLEQV